MCGGVYIGEGDPLGPAHRSTEVDSLGPACRRGGAQGSPHPNPNQYRGAWVQHTRGHAGPNRPKEGPVTQRKIILLTTTNEKFSLLS
jgi:hypothetical protein